MYEYEEALFASGVHLVAGTDEAGRGPLAGPVYAAAVILDPADPIAGIDDSKKLTARTRERLAREIRARALAFAVVAVDAATIDRINIYAASRRAMTEAIAALSLRPEHVLTDAMPLPGFGVPFTAIIHGDALSASIGAASILAKVDRDAYMRAMDERYPGYGFAQHKGYPTKDHLAALARLGPSPLHRRSYAPVRDVIERQLALALGQEERP